MTLQTALNIVQVVLAIVLILAVLLQTKGSTLSGIFGGGDTTSVYRTRRGWWHGETWNNPRSSDENLVSGHGNCGSKANSLGNRHRTLTRGIRLSGKRWRDN